MSSPAVTTGVHAGLDHNSTVVVTVVSLLICGVVYAPCKPLSTYLGARYVYRRSLLLLPSNPKTDEIQLLNLKKMVLNGEVTVEKHEDILISGVMRIVRTLLFCL